MDYVMTALWVVAALGLLLAWTSRSRLSALEQKLEEMRRDTSIKAADEEETKESVAGLRKLVAQMAGGREVDSSMVLENRLYRNVTSADLQQKVEGGAAGIVIDVRTPQEWAGGHIEGALHIPVDEVQKRLHEVPRDGREMFVICAAGGRSAAAADFLSNRGYLNVFNVEGGMGQWRGTTVRD
ncbi:MAG: rhodanese-like domain-containing protein [Planctomycetota bacterium]|jgi:rhodanese-related sulfurtransferase